MVNVGYLEPIIEDEIKRQHINEDIKIRVLAHRELGVSGRIDYTKDKNGKIIKCDLRIDEDELMRGGIGTARHELKHLSQACKGLDSKSFYCQTVAYLYEFKRSLDDSLNYVKKLF